MQVLLIIGIIIYAIVRSKKNEQTKKQNQQKWEQNRNNPTPNSQRPPQASDLIETLFKQINSSTQTRTPSEQAQPKRTLSDQDRQRLEAYRAQRKARQMDQSRSQFEPALNAHHEIGEGESMSTALKREVAPSAVHAPLSTREPYVGSLPLPSESIMEGDCLPEHTHESSIAATEIANATDHSPSDMPDLRSAIIWSELLKRPRMGVAPRFR